MVDEEHGDGEQNDDVHDDVEHETERSPDSGRNGTPARCAACGARLDAGDWHPTVGHTDPNETYQIVRFCSGECRDEWRTTPEERDET